MKLIVFIFKWSQLVGVSTKENGLEVVGAVLEEGASR